MDTRSALIDPSTRTRSFSFRLMATGVNSTSFETLHIHDACISHGDTRHQGSDRVRMPRMPGTRFCAWLPPRLKAWPNVTLLRLLACCVFPLLVMRNSLDTWLQLMLLLLLPDTASRYSTSGGAWSIQPNPDQNTQT